MRDIEWFLQRHNRWADFYNSLGRYYWRTEREYVQLGEFTPEFKVVFQFIIN